MRNMTSTSVYLMCKNVQRELVNMCIYDGAISYADVIQFVNPYEYIFSPCPQTTTPICTLQTQSSSFFELWEICEMLDLQLEMKRCLLKTDHKDDVIKCVKQRTKQTMVVFHTIQNTKTQYGFVFYEVKYDASLENYVADMVTGLMTLLSSQSVGGTAIVKVNYLFHRPILDVVYILSSMYEQVYIVKPNISSAVSYDKYIVCINKILNQNNNANYEILSGFTNKRLYSLVGHNLPLSFVNKINDVNVILGQRQLEYLDQALTIMHSTNKYDAIHLQITKNAQKSAVMCEKLGLPFTKTNVFLGRTNVV